MDVHTPDQLGYGFYQQNSDLFKPWRPVATNQGAWSSSFPIPRLAYLKSIYATLTHIYFPSYPDGVCSNPETSKKIHIQILIRDNYSKQIMGFFSSWSVRWRYWSRLIACCILHEPNFFKYVCYESFFIGDKYSHLAIFLRLMNPHWKLYLISLLHHPPFISKQLHFFIYPSGLGNCC